MPIHHPEDFHQAFAEAFNAGDLDALAALYEPEAVFVPQVGPTVTGIEAIRAALSGFLALKGTMTLNPLSVVTAGDIALIRGAWTLTGTAPDGSIVNLSGRSAEVARRQADGTWSYVIDHPHGAS